jgi:hypothetical protein
MRGVKSEEVPGMSMPMRRTFPTGCATARSGTTSILRVKVTMHPTALHHMVVSLSQPYADLLPAI